MTKSKSLRIGIIGAGGRGVNGYVRYFKDYHVPAELTAIADPAEASRKRCMELVDELQGSKPTAYSDWKEMLNAEPTFDGMIIATPNHLHFAPALDCLESGVKAIALEKPLATRPGDCDRILDEADARGAAVQLGFVLRSTPFYRKVKELIGQGVVGKIVSIQADELVSARVSSVNFRGPWRRYSATSGGSLLEKCSHDMDILTWLASSSPSRVSSFGGQAIFTPNGNLPDQCDAKCPLSQDCPYFSENDRVIGFQGAKKVENVCVYNSGADVADHQSVQIHYQNGVVCNFMLNFNTDGERSNRNLHVIGTRGRIWGNHAHKSVMSHDLASDEFTEHPLTVDSSGHGGGNLTHALEFLRLVSGENTQPVATAYDAYLSAMMCFAADRSRSEGRQVAFRYPAARRVAID